MDDYSKMKNIGPREPQSSVHSFLRVKVKRGNTVRRDYTFSDSFTVGRSEECSIQLNDGVVSRVHAEITSINGKWYLTDKNSRNGTFLNGKKVDRAEIVNNTSFELGSYGPVLSFYLEEKGKPSVKNVPQNASVTSYIKYYFDDSEPNHEMGEHTRIIREAFKAVRKKQKSKYLKLIIILGVFALAGLSYAIIQHTKENKQKQLAENIFYDMKALELEISSLKKQFANSKDPSIVSTLEKFDEKRQRLESNYNKLIDDLDVYDINDEDRIIVRISRIFGECEFGIPPKFIDEVKNYIKKWQSSSRLSKALERAEEKGYPKIIANYFISNQLPPQFFYLALQESDFKEDIIGPPTRFGYAKGMWQFISLTAQKYGLGIGPLAGQNVFDPGDDRFNITKATNAAAKYIKDIYNTDAQASGLLVMASYNWGEHNVIPLLRSMPENPRERNFWKLLEKYKEKIPFETYNYVFYIVSAAVICENPRLFGFNFDNPLKNVVQSTDK